MSTAATRHRPLVVGQDPRRFWHLTLTLATTDFKLRFYGSVLGYAWTLVKPFAFFGVIWFVFAEIVDAGRRRQELPGLHPHGRWCCSSTSRASSPPASAAWSIARTCCARSAFRAW